MNALPCCWLLQRGRDAEATAFGKVTRSAPDITWQNERTMGKIKEKPHKMHAMTAWRSCPHACMSKSTECPDCLGNPPLPTARGHLPLLPLSREEPLSHSQSGPKRLPVPVRLFLILIKRCQLHVVCLFNILLLNSILTPEMQPLLPSPRALPASCPVAVPWGRCLRHLPWSGDRTSAR